MSNPYLRKFLEAQRPKIAAVSPKTPPVWRTMTDLERRAVGALGHVRFPSGTRAKRFAHDIARQLVGGIITDRQAEYLWLVAYHFRRQIHDKDVGEQAQAARALR